MIMNYTELCRKIIEGQRFDFSRWGDGEWNAIAGKNGNNCDGHQYFDDLGEALRNVLKSSPKYYLGLQGLASKQRPEMIKDYTDKYGLNWCDSDFLHRESWRGNLQPFIDALNTRDVLIVGGPHLKELKLFDFYIVTVPHKNCWLKYHEVKKDINALIEHKDWVILYAASMMSNVLIDDFQGKVTQIDVGSVFDPYVDVKSRKYHHELKI